MVAGDKRSEGRFSVGSGKWEVESTTVQISDIIKAYSRPSRRIIYAVTRYRLHQTTADCSRLQYITLEASLLPYGGTKVLAPLAGDHECFDQEKVTKRHI